MAVELKKIILKDNYLHCHFEGEFSKLARMKENTQRILKAYKDNNCSRGILDFSKITGKINLLYEHFLGLHI